MFELLRGKSKGQAVREKEILTATGWKADTLRTYYHKRHLNDFLGESGSDFVALQGGDDLSEGEFAFALTQVKHVQRSAFLRRMRPCRALSKIIGLKPVTRPELPRRVWAYIRKHGVQSTGKSLTIECDDALLPVGARIFVTAGANGLRDDRRAPSCLSAGRRCDLLRDIHWWYFIGRAERGAEQVMPIDKVNVAEAQPCYAARASKIQASVTTSGNPRATVELGTATGEPR